MTKNPPAPIMSAKAGEENRPSTFPLAALRSINKAAQAAQEEAADAAGEALTRTELEAAGGKRLRIPDVIVLKCPPSLLIELKNGKADIRHFIPAQQNIERIVEVKFDGDFLSKYQAIAYQDIAGSAEFNILEPEHENPELGCKCQKKRRQPKSAPVLVPDTVPGRMPSRRSSPVKPEMVPYPSGMRPLGETLQTTPTSSVSGWAVVLVGALVVVAIAAAPETGGASLLLLAAP
ncbi:hypothetical protein GR157_36310 [Burkholderia sp. 4701]|nr:hypothetical protein [Burkholderia sp. 4701]MXN87375.1 hypothetical protein [Burkholderia sp. 4812]